MLVYPVTYRWIMLYAKLKQVRRPYSGEVLGTRIVIAVNNDSGNPKFDKFNSTGNCMSFKPPYMLAESSDLADIGTVEEQTIYIENFLNQFNDTVEVVGL